MNKKRLSDHSGPSPSHFKGVVSLAPLEDLVHDGTNHDSAELSPIIRSGGDEIERIVAGNMNNPQDAVSDRVHESNNVIEEQHAHESLMSSTVLGPISTRSGGVGTVSTPLATNVRSRKGNQSHYGGGGSHGKRSRKKRNQTVDGESTTSTKCRLLCCRDRKVRRNIQSCMSFVARLLLWCTVVASVALVVWYSYELKNNGCVLSNMATRLVGKISLVFILH
jgi:hypothetical protein